MNARDNAAMQALSDAGAQCGDCGDQPGDRICPDCERCYGWYVAALRKAGWAPRAEVLAEAADKLALEMTPETPGAGPGFLLAIRLCVRALRSMSDKAAAS
ncbi:hypothetical protein [Streptomyces sp. NBC_01794]|uniref:hypothetical protein n=1 Tax=Streptomyces sp. NBC_01794 TaxID=2975942 RepID=UPI00308D49DE|nr:hypothetical protein OIE54_12285 [Streptomyces sp. NBC_01794]